MASSVPELLSEETAVVPSMGDTTESVSAKGLIQAVAAKNPEIINDFGGVEAFNRTLDKIDTLDQKFRSKGGVHFKLGSTPKETARIFAGTQLQYQEIGARPSLPAQVVHYLDGIGLSRDNPHYKAALLVAARAEVEHASHPEYHNQNHFSDVMVQTIEFLKKNNELADKGVSGAVKMTPEQLADGLTAAAGHDTGHPGGKNSLPGEKTASDPFRLERQSVDINEPLLKAAGLPQESINRIESVILTTSPDMNGPGKMLKEIDRLHDDGKTVEWEKLPDHEKFPELKVLAEDPVARAMSENLRAADIGKSVLQGPAARTKATKALQKEWEVRGYADKLTGDSKTADGSVIKDGRTIKDSEWFLDNMAGGENGPGAPAVKEAVGDTYKKLYQETKVKARDVKAEETAVPPPKPSVDVPAVAPRPPPVAPADDAQIEAVVRKVFDPKTAETLHNIPDPEIRRAIEKHALGVENLKYQINHDSDVNHPDIPESVRGEANLSGRNLEGMDLSGLHLEGINLTNANLKNTVLKDTNLGGANLKGADLSKADMRGAHLMGASMDHAKLKGTNLGPSESYNANLFGAHMDGADLTDANLRDAMVAPHSAKGAHFNGADLTSADVRLGDFEGADLKGAVLKDIKIDGCTVLSTKQLAESKDVPDAVVRHASVREAVDEPSVKTTTPKPQKQHSSPPVSESPAPAHEPASKLVAPPRPKTSAPVAREREAVLTAHASVHESAITTRPPVPVKPVASQPKTPAPVPTTHAPAPELGLMARISKGLSHSMDAIGAVMGVMGFIDARERKDTKGEVIAAGNVTTSVASSTLKVLKTTGKLVAPALEKGIGKANVVLTVADGVYQISKEDTGVHKVQRATAVTATAGTGAAVAAVLGGAVVAPVVATVAVGITADKAVEITRTLEKADKIIGDVKVDRTKFSNIRTAPMLLKKELGELGVTKDAKGNFDFRNPANVEKLTKLIDKEKKASQETIETTDSDLPRWMQDGEKVETHTLAKQRYAQLNAASKELPDYMQKLKAQDALEANRPAAAKSAAPNRYTTLAKAHSDAADLKQTQQHRTRAPVPPEPGK